MRSEIRRRFGDAVDRWSRFFMPETAWPIRAGAALATGLVAYLMLVEIVLQGVFGRIDLALIPAIGSRNAPIPREIFLNGAVVGSLYGLIGLGLILVYRANRIINFAQAQLGAVAASAALMLLTFRNWAYLAVIPLVLIGGGAVGGTVEMVFVRRFSRSPRLILTVVTIGIGLVLQALEFFTKKWIVGDQFLQSVAAQYKTPFSRWWSQQIGTLTFSGDHIFTLAVVIGLAVGLAAFFRYTDLGIAVRASSENRDRASLLGIPVKRVSTVVWTLAAVLSAIGVFLRGPLVGIPITGFVGPTLLLYGLAAAVIARMKHMYVAIAAGMLIGIVEQSVVFTRSAPGLVSPVLLVVIVIALLAQRSHLARGLDPAAGSWQAAAELRPVPLELRDLPVVRRARALLQVVVGLVVVLAPWIVGSARADTASRIAIVSIVGVSLVILTGWTGQISLGQWGIAALGAAVAGGLAANHNWDFFLTIAVAGACGAGVAVLIGLPALRIQGLFLAVTTLAFAFTMTDFVLRRQWFSWLLPEQRAFADRPNLYGVFDLTEPTPLGPVNVSADAKFYYLCVLFLGLALYLARSLRKNRSGRLLIGVRDNPRLLQAYGVNLARTRLAAFAISGFIAAIGGALFAYQFGQIDPDAFLPQQSVAIFLMTVIGGASSLTGAVLGAVYVLGIPLLPVLRDVQFIELLTSGFGVLLILMALPGGLIEGLYRLRDGWLRRVAERQGIHVPSLVADSLVLDNSDEQQVVADAGVSMEAVR
ncbi:MAG TPA: ABC transporter permease [Acidimicrobiales bacterium]|nr:ABC transporter permease [Acidimicrobiales bacterium]